VDFFNNPFIIVLTPFLSTGLIMRVNGQFDCFDDRLRQMALLLQILPSE